MTEKALGYILLAVGLVTIAFAGMNTIQVFRNKAEPVQVFTLPGLSFDILDMAGSELSPQEKNAIKASGANTKMEILSGDVLSDTTNVFAHLFLMGFIVNLGAKIAGLGVQLVRPINVHLKEKHAAAS